MNQWKSAHAVDTELRTLEDAMAGADVCMGISAKGAFTRDMISAMAPHPLIFAMANPDPEITPEEVTELRDDAIVPTGPSAYPTQINHELGFPSPFHAAFDGRAPTPQTS